MTKMERSFVGCIVSFRTGNALRVAADPQTKKKTVIKCHSIYVATELRKFLTQKTRKGLPSRFARLEIPFVSCIVSFRPYNVSCIVSFRPCNRA